MLSVSEHGGYDVGVVDPTAAYGDLSAQPHKYTGYPWAIFRTSKCRSNVATSSSATPLVMPIAK